MVQTPTHYTMRVPKEYESSPRFPKLCHPNAATDDVGAAAHDSSSRNPLRFSVNTSFSENRRHARRWRIYQRTNISISRVYRLLFQLPQTEPIFSPYPLSSFYGGACQAHCPRPYQVSPTAASVHFLWVESQLSVKKKKKGTQ